jgi:hypothetical protein
MSFLDKAKAKLTDAVDQHGDKIAQGIDKAGGMASKKTGGKHDAHIAKGSAAAKDALDKLDGKNDDIPDASPSTGGARPEGGTPGH